MSAIRLIILQALAWVMKLGFIAMATALTFYSVPAAVVAICATILVALAGKAGSLIEVSFGPLKAKLEREVTEAEKLLMHLRRLAAVQSRAAIAASAHTGRLASGDDWIFQSAKRIESAMRDAGLDENSIKEARTELIQLTIRDAGRRAGGGSYIPQKAQACQDEWREGHKTGLFNDPDQLEAWLRKWDALNPDREQLLSDMRWMKGNGDIQDSAMYMRAHADDIPAIGGR